MVTVESAASFLLERSLVDVSTIIDGELVVRRFATPTVACESMEADRSGLFLKQSGDAPARGTPETRARGEIPAILPGRAGPDRGGTSRSKYGSS